MRVFELCVSSLGREKSRRSPSQFAVDRNGHKHTAAVAIDGFL
jgi:hypothetical protein